jgi:NADH-dependent peroxiredoxin subunit C
VSPAFFLFHVFMGLLYKTAGAMQNRFARDKISFTILGCFILNPDNMTELEYSYEMVKIDTPAPSFDLPAYDPIKDTDTRVSLESLKGKWSVLFYYPADFTFVCPTELKDLAEAKARLDAANVTVLAASTDTVFSHRAWVKHEGLMKDFPYLMLSDHTGVVADMYNIYDHETGNAGRGTFVIDPEGVVRVIEVTSGPLGRNSEELVRRIEALQFMAQNPGVACPARWTKGAKTLTPSIKISGEVAEQLA